MFAGGSSAPDPYALGSVAALGLPSDPYDNRTGRTQVNPTTLTGRVKTLIAYGQSNIATFATGTYTAVSSNVVQMSIVNGGLYRAANAMLGDSYGAGFENMLIRLGDKMIVDNYCDTVVLVPIAVGGSSSAQWAAGGALNHRFAVVKNRLTSIGLTPNFVLRHQGETDGLNGTTQVALSATMASEISSIRSAGISCLILVAKASWVSSALPSNTTAIRAAQASVVNGTDVLQGPDTDTINNTGRSDGTHLNADGHANLWKPIIEAH